VSSVHIVVLRFLVDVLVLKARAHGHLSAVAHLMYHLSRYSCVLPDPALIGLAIAHALGMTVTLNWASKSTAEAETKLNAVERVLEYSDLELEAAYEIEDTKPAESWPSDGLVCFDNVVMSYRPELQPALRGVTFASKPSEKIGIVGRTG
jgi:ATP-binding cassette, subfamily C (CFTR/MRP), member 1